MKISIIIPTFNRAEYLKKAIESALAQDYESLEIIVSDNASTDSTEEIIQRYINDRRFKYFRNKDNLGMVANWRKALFEHADGDFFIILSDDDYFIDNQYISNAVKLIENNPDMVLVFSNGYIYYEDLNEKIELKLPFDDVAPGKEVFLSRGKLKPQAFTLCNVLFSRKLALKLDAFSNPYNISCDSELFLKMCLYGSVGVIKDFVSVYTIHNKNLINSLNTDEKLLINNFDHVLEPYIYAQGSGLFTDHELDIWIEELVIPLYIDVIESVLLYNPENHLEILKNIDSKNPEIYSRVLKKSKIRTVLFLNKIKMLKLAFKIRKMI